MEAAAEVEVVAVPAARFMGSAEGFGGGGGVSGVRKDESCAANSTKPAFWGKISNSDFRLEARRSSSSCSDDALKNNDSGNTNSPSLSIDLEARRVLQKNNRVVRSYNGCTKRPMTVQMEVSKTQPGIRDVNGITPEIASSLASCNISEKTQLVKQKNSSNHRRGEKRNSKALKNRSDSLSMKNGVAGFNLASGGNSFSGVYGLKPDTFDITKYVNELSLDELLHGSHDFPSVAKDKGKKVANSNNNILQSVRKACSILQTQKVSVAQKCAEVESSCIGNISAGFLAKTPVDLMSSDQGECFIANLPSSDMAEECGGKIKRSNSIGDSHPHQPKDTLQPKDVLERLALPPPKDLDLLLSDASKVASSSKNSADLRIGKAVSNRTGLAPFPWSHSFSGHNRLGADSVKPSANRPICHGRWVKIKNSTILQEGSLDFLVDFETLKFDPSIVPKLSKTSERSTSGAPPPERVLSSSGACSTLKVHADEDSPTYAAARTLCGMVTDSSKGNPSAAVKSLKKPSYVSMKACKLKAIEKPDKLFDPPKSTMRPINPGKIVDDGSPSKRQRLSMDGTNSSIMHPDSVRKGPQNWSGPQSVRSPPRKLFRDSNTGTDSYRINFVKAPYLMKPPSSSSQQKLRKVVPVKWSRPV